MAKLEGKIPQTRLELIFHSDNEHPAAEVRETFPDSLLHRAYPINEVLELEDLFKKRVLFCSQVWMLFLAVKPREEYPAILFRIKYFDKSIFVLTPKIGDTLAGEPRFVIPSADQREDLHIMPLETYVQEQI